MAGGILFVATSQRKVWQEYAGFISKIKNCCISDCNANCGWIYIYKLDTAIIFLNKTQSWRLIFMPKREHGLKICAAGDTDDNE